MLLISYTRAGHIFCTVLTKTISWLGFHAFKTKYNHPFFEEWLITGSRCTASESLHVWVVWWKAYIFFMKVWGGGGYVLTTMLWCCDWHAPKDLQKNYRFSFDVYMWSHCKQTATTENQRNSCSEAATFIQHKGYECTNILYEVSQWLRDGVHFITSDRCSDCFRVVLHE